MHIKILLNKLVPFVVAVVTAVTLTGCFDLGEFEDEEAYYASFGDVKLVYQNSDSEEKDIRTKDYSVEDYFYNRNTGNDFSYGNPDDDLPDEGKDIPQLPYLYLAIPVEDDFSIDSLVLYFNATSQCTVNVVIYVVDELPDGGDFTEIRLFGDPEYQEKQDENGETIKEPIVYSDPSEEFIVGNGFIHASNNEWTSMIIEKWKGEETLVLEDGQFILLRFVNNGWERAEGQQECAFRTTNLLVRADSIN